MLEIQKKPVDPDIMILSLSGKIAMGRDCQELDSTVDELIREKILKVIIDLSDVRRVDSTGLGMIVTCSRKLKNAGGELRVAGAKGVVEEISRASNIPRIVAFHPTVEEAAAGFAVAS